MFTIAIYFSFWFYTGKRLLIHKCKKPLKEHCQLQCIARFLFTHALGKIPRGFCWIEKLWLCELASFKYTIANMSSDTDEDLSPERYDPEDNLNFYGSPIFEPNDAPRPSIAVSRRTEVSIYTFCHHQFILTNNSPRISL